MKFHTLRGVSLIIVVLLLNNTAFAQDKEIVEGDVIVADCGSVIEGEFNSNYERHYYAVNMKAGDTMQISASPLGDQLRSSLVLLGPTELALVISDQRGNLGTDGKYYRLGIEKNPKIVSGVLSASGKYLIGVNNFEWNYSPRDSGGIGVYTLYIGCTLRDGTVINPGDKPAINTSDPTIEATSAPVFSGFGFPGLAPIDLSNTARLPIPPGIPLSGALTPTGSEILGYLFKAEAGDTVEVSFNRLTGNLNLGIVVINAQSQVIFQASLVTTQSMTTRFTIPESGEYTAAVFRIDLLPVANPEPTAFSVKAVVNPST
ncbi:MAG: hypothetical protein GC179_26950 [Anaerolineaceae bacterium]|nr:hypothetical protein [Anaerolineaceae bacterium]